MQIARLGIGSALAGGVLGVAAMVGVGVGVHQYTANAQTPPTASATPVRGALAADYIDKLAANLGISADQLKAANVTTLNQLIDEALAAGRITADQAAQAKQHVADEGGAHLGPIFGAFTARGAHNRPGGPGGPGASRGQRPEGVRGGLPGMSAVATFLGIDQQTLMQELMSGKSLAQVAADHGKTRDELKAELTSTFGASIDQMIDRVFQMPHRGAPDTTQNNTPSS